MIRNTAGTARGRRAEMPFCCVTCGRRTLRVFKEDRGGFGVCICGGELRRAGSIADERRAAKAKAELEGGPSR